MQCFSILCLIAMDYRCAYNVTKFAPEGYTNTLRQELHGSSIQVSLIEPGPIQSEFSKAGTTKLKLQPNAVVSKLTHAIEAPKAKARYYITVPPTSWAAYDASCQLQ